MIEVLLRKSNAYLSEKIKGLFQLYLFEYGRLCKNLRVGIKLYRITRVYAFYYKPYLFGFFCQSSQVWEQLKNPEILGLKRIIPISKGTTVECFTIQVRKSPGDGIILKYVDIFIERFPLSITLEILSITLEWISKKFRKIKYS